MTIAVWGGGFIGRNLLTVLLEQGRVNLYLLTRDRQSSINISGVDVPARCVTFQADTLEMTRNLDGVSVLIHCAGSPYDEYDDYLDAAINMANAAVAANVRRVILVSTVAIYGAGTLDCGADEILTVSTGTSAQPNSPYAQSRYKAEIQMRSILQKSGVDFIVVRVPMVVGAGMNATLFKRMSALLSFSLRPTTGRLKTWLPCIGIERLRNVLAVLATIPVPTKELYQFADRVAWSEVIRMCDPNPHRWKLPLPVRFVHSCAAAFKLSFIASPALSLLNIRCYTDDSEAVLPGSGNQWPTIDCVAKAAIESLTK